ncbi:MAG: acetate/propionate family kinase [Burkholderiaceae bacterium]
MTDMVLVLNAGSSSIKFRAFDAAAERLLLRGQIEGLYTAARFRASDAAGATLGTHEWPGGSPLGHDRALAFLMEFLHGRVDGHRLVAVGHRVVHGGLAFTRPVRVTPALLASLARLSPLAPLHQPHNLKAIEVLAQLQHDLPQVACFDTAFHRTHSELAQAYALPASITAHGVRRYGFHGLSYEYIAGVLPRFDARAAAGRTIVAHLGNGSSACALVAGRSVASTMGFTTVDGLPMGTRCGSLDPGVILYLIDELKMDARTIERLIYEQSGLLGVSELSSDMRTLLASDDPRARFAIDLYVHRIGREIGSLAAAAQGVDALVFTAGIGENAVAIRQRVCEQASWLGVRLDAAANAAGGPRISRADSPVAAWVIPTDEELMIARHTRQVLAAAGDGRAAP